MSQGTLNSASTALPAVDGGKKMRLGFATNFGFIMAAVGSAVGLGNLWKFPAIAGKYGGGAFVLVYLGCVLLVGIPLMYAELVIGRRGKKDVVGALKDTTKSAGWSGKLISYSAGAMAVLAGFMILAFYAVVAGWAFHYVGVSLGWIAGTELGAKDTFGQLYGATTITGNWSVLWHTIAMALTVAVVVIGVRGGIEKLCKVLLPCLFVMLLGLLGYVIVNGMAGASVSYLFNPDFSKLSGEAVLQAMGHAFFTLSLGMGAMITYGSYVKNDKHIVRDGMAIVALDTVIALIAGIVIFGVILSKGPAIESESAAVLFTAIPELFSQMPGGAVFSTIFFLLVIFAAWSSMVSLLEVVVAHFVDHWKLPRWVVATGIGVLIWAVGLLVACNMGLADLGFDSETSVFDFMDNVTTNYLLPIGGLLVAIAAGWCLTKEDRDAGFDPLGKRGRVMSKLWLISIRYVTPILVLVVILWKTKALAAVGLM